MIVSKSGNRLQLDIRVLVLGGIIATVLTALFPRHDAAALPLLDSTVNRLTGTVDNVVDKTVSPITQSVGNTVERTVPALTTPVTNTLDRTLNGTVPSLVNPLVNTVDGVVPGLADPVRSVVNQTVPAVTDQVTRPIGNLVQNPSVQPPLNPNTGSPTVPTSSNRSGRSDTTKKQASENSDSTSRPPASQRTDDKKREPKNIIEQALGSLSSLYSKFMEGARSIRLHPAALALGLIMTIATIAGTVFYTARYGRNWASSGAGVLIGNKLHINANVIRYMMFGISIIGLAFLGFVLASL